MPRIQRGARPPALFVPISVQRSPESTWLSGAVRLRVVASAVRSYGHPTSRPRAAHPIRCAARFLFGAPMNTRRLNEPISAASTAVASLLISRLDCERIEALLDSPVAQSVDTSALRAELDRADVIEPARVPPDVITMNSTAHFTIEGSDEVREVTLVYPRDADGSASRVSILAPVGSALLGLRVGEAIRWPVPGGHLGLRVLSIDYQPEAASEFHR